MAKKSAVRTIIVSNAHVCAMRETLARLVRAGVDTINGVALARVALVPCPVRGGTGPQARMYRGTTAGARFAAWERR